MFIYEGKWNEASSIMTLNKRGEKRRRLIEMRTGKVTDWTTVNQEEFVYLFSVNHRGRRKDGSKEEGVWVNPNNNKTTTGERIRQWQKRSSFY